MYLLRTEKILKIHVSLTLNLVWWAVFGDATPGSLLIGSFLYERERTKLLEPGTKLRDVGRPSFRNSFFTRKGDLFF